MRSGLGAVAASGTGGSAGSRPWRPDQTREEVAERLTDVLLSTCVSLELLVKNGELDRCSDIAAFRSP
ncbi:hypothetical protein [Sciscionella marina]|uniref:hypothetical protein n=1 Tax=Sciscionella marina TaxID=508770 RepID=UPI000382A8D0|nr:hypothetical protein [Sciscionella marina]